MATKINGQVWAADLDDGITVLVGIGNDTYVFDRRKELADFIGALVSHVIEAQPDQSKVKAAKKVPHAQP